MKATALRLLGIAGLASIPIEACLLPFEIHPESGPGHHAWRRQENGTHPLADQDRYLAWVKQSTIPLAANGTDRFQGGETAPRGLGSQSADTVIKTSMNIVEMRSAVQGLVKEFGVEWLDLPEKSAGGATMFAGKLSDNKCGDAYRVYLASGVHARERGGPDGIIYFISDLLWAKRENKGLTYGKQSYTAADVQKALSTGIIFQPLQNPDGVLYDQNTNLCWRKNRNPNGQVDLNRNYDFLWDFEKTFLPGADPASSRKAMQTYHGTKAFSEPETQNVKWVMDTYKQVNWFLDLHSFSGLVLYSWGDDENQDTQPEMNFMNPKFDGKRGLTPRELDGAPDEYKSYISRSDWDQQKRVSDRVALAMQNGNSGTLPISSVQSIELYATSGASSDYAFSRSFVDPSLTTVRGISIEFGGPNGNVENPNVCPFYPNETSYNTNLREVGAGLMEFLLAAADAGVGGPVDCSRTQVQDQGQGPGQGSGQGQASGGQAKEGGATGLAGVSAWGLMTVTAAAAMLIVGI